MSKYINYFCGGIVDKDIMPDPESFLAASVFVALFYQPDGSRSSIYVTCDGMPIIVLRHVPSDPNKVYIPPYDELNDLCSEQSFKVFGQPYSIEDMIVRDGRFGFKRSAFAGMQMKRNLSNSTYTVLIDS